jgi:NAD(P)-dependent dehydrogenase (short-subunit alcohol dehydrogenase family)
MTASKLAIYPSLAGRGVFITGGATGIGAAFVEAFARNGAKVAFVDIDIDAADQLVSRLNSELGQSVWCRETDVTNSESLEAAIHDAGKAVGGLHTLINNAACDTRHDIESFGLSDWRQCMALNLDAAYVACRAAVAEMKARQQGAIINMSSINAPLGLPGMPGYVTAKAGLIGMTKALSQELGEHNIRVNAILPGWVATERQLEQWLTPEREAEWQKQVALKRRLVASDVANLAVFLSADESEMITGQSLVIDAGRT